MLVESPEIAELEVVEDEEDVLERGSGCDGVAPSVGETGSDDMGADVFIVIDFFFTVCLDGCVLIMNDGQQLYTLSF